MHKVLVTGGAGFIGSHLVDALVHMGCQVTVVDSLITGQRSNLKQHAKSKQLTFREVDIRKRLQLEPCFKGIDTVFHLAALADIVPSIERPDDYFSCNVEGTFNVLESCRAHKVPKILYAASSSCYGIAETLPTPESAPIRPEYPYALTKNVGEQLLMHWGNLYDLNVNSLRFFNVYGPRSRTSGTYGAVFGVFLAQKLNKKPFTIVGDGNQTRDFTYVSDVVAALIAAAESDVRGEIMNVGSNKTVSVNRIAELLGGEKVHIPKRPGEPDCTFADISKIKRLIQWQPCVTIEAGIQKLLENISGWREAPVWTPDTIQKATRTWFKYLGKS